MALPRSNRTTAPARSSCTCPLCTATTIDADGVYHCRAGETVEYLIFVAGEFLGARPNFLTAETELNAARRDRLTAPVELAAAEADLDAEAAAYVAESANEYDGFSDEQVQEMLNNSVMAGHLDLADQARSELERRRARSGECRECWGAGNMSKRLYAGHHDLCLACNGTGKATPPAEILPFTPENSPLDPRPTPPAISYSVRFGGFTWAGALYVYPTYLAADEARAEWLKTPPRGMLLAA